MKKTSQHKIRHLLTAEGEALLSKDSGFIPWNTYPRPQMKRDSFFCLNGTWEVSVNGGEPQPIRIPFCPESRLSGICLEPSEANTLIYRKTFTLPEGFEGGRILLHFGAVDQKAAAYLNGQFIGMHEGGYEPFDLDLTDRLQTENHLVVEVWDDLRPHTLPYGKQRADRGGMWYTPVSGIWQTVWVEAVPRSHVEHLRVDTTQDTATITAYVTYGDFPEDVFPEGKVTVHTPDGDLTVPMIEGKATVKVPSPRLWSPEDPYLYEFTVEVGYDKVQSYFALRTLEIKKVDGIPRLCLNGKPYFLHALLDQGYWSDGIYTPAAPECYEQDILAMKSLGFNTLRKHIKVEPEQFYYDCDRLGMLVMQDMVNNGHYSFIRDTALPTIGIKKLSDKRLHRDKATRKAFDYGMTSTVGQLRNHPCIVYWTIFNEGWGQFDGDTAYHSLREMDSTRFIDTASGWFKVKNTDVDSEHVYFKPVKLKYSDKPMVLSEFGGYAWKIDDHAANPDHTYGYRMFKDGQSFEEALVKLYEDEIIPAVSKGLCGAVYTQVSDVEDETNGLLTYDRRLLKVKAEAMQEIARKLNKAILDPL